MVFFFFFSGIYVSSVAIGINFIGISTFLLELFGAFNWTGID